MSKEASQWIHLDPVYESDGTPYACNLVIDFSCDWQDWSIESQMGAGGRFTLYIPNEYVWDILNIRRIEVVESV